MKINHITEVCCINKPNYYYELNIIQLLQPFPKFKITHMNYSLNGSSCR